MQCVSCRQQKKYERVGHPPTVLQWRMVEQTRIDSRQPRCSILGIQKALRGYVCTESVKKRIRLRIQVTFTCFMALLCIAQGRAAGSGVPLTYELYSWQGPKNDWNFCLLHTTNRQKTVQEVFNNRSVLHGIEELRHKMAELPPGTSIVWFDRLTLSGVRLKGSEGLKYPPKETIEEISRYADVHGIQISGPERESQ